MGSIAGEGDAPYDEAALRAQLDRVSTPARVLFACACAEQLMLVFAFYKNYLDRDIFRRTREALDLAWSSASHIGTPAPDIDLWVNRLEEYASIEYDDERLSFAVSQNAIAAVAYAMRALRTGRSQEAAWAARQLYDAADTVLQFGAPANEYVAPVEREAPIAIVLRSIKATLCDADRVTPIVLRERAELSGRELLALMRGSGQ